MTAAVTMLMLTTAWAMLERTKWMRRALGLPPLRERRQGERRSRERRVPGNSGPWLKPVSPPTGPPPPGLPPRASADSGRSATPPFGVVASPRTVVGTYEVTNADGEVVATGNLCAWSIDAALMGDYTYDPPATLQEGCTVVARVEGYAIR